MATTKVPRALTWRAEQVFHAANALQAHGQKINARAIRSIFEATRVCTEDAGSQWIGDSLGGHGLHLLKDRKGNYILPDGGITPELIVEWFGVPPGYPWDGDSEKYYPCAAALQPETPPKQPCPPAPPDAGETRTEEADTVRVQVAETRQDPDKMSDPLVCALVEARCNPGRLAETFVDVFTELMRVTYMLRGVLTAAETGLQTAARLLGVTDSSADNPPSAAD